MSRHPRPRAVRAALLKTGGAPQEEIAGLVGTDALEKLLATRHVAIQPGVRSDDAETARFCLAEEFAKLTARRGAEAEIEEAVRDFDDTADENLTWRVSQVAEARDRAGRAASADRAEYDTGPNGARMRRDEKSAFEALLREIGKGGGRGRVIRMAAVPQERVKTGPSGCESPIRTK